MCMEYEPMFHMYSCNKLHESKVNVNKVQATITDQCYFVKVLAMLKLSQMTNESIQAHAKLMNYAI